MGEDPFAGPAVDRTVIMPVPGGRTPAPGRLIPEAPLETLETTVITSGLNPLVAAANTLLNAIPPLRASITPPNPAALRDSLAHNVRQFEAQARAAGVPMDQVIAARYALCTLIDETVATTPWGASGAWAQRGLLVLFHNETWGGEKFFQLLARLVDNPHANLDLLELMYVCLQFSFEGRYRIAEGGQRQLEVMRQQLVSIIRKQRGEYERDLSPSWQGSSAAVQPRLGWTPLWVVGAVTAVLLVVVYGGFRLSLSRASDKLALEIASLRVAAHVPAPRPAPELRLARFLAEEIRRNLVAVDDRPDRSIVTILGDGLFKPGEITVGSENQWLMLRIAEALNAVSGQVDVIGYTDNVPIRTLRFPSNWELSKARAESVAKLLTTRVAPERIRADGRGDADPVAGNATPEGRARNRRVEITLYVPAGTSPGGPGAAPRTP